LLVALLVAAVGIGAILNLFINVAGAAHRDARRAQIHALGRGLIATWQTVPRAEVRERLAEGEQAWPREPAPLEVPDGSEVSGVWQWRWEGPLPEEGPLSLVLQITTARRATIELQATL
jgi:hypothetical protein